MAALIAAGSRLASRQVAPGDQSGQVTLADIDEDATDQNRPSATQNEPVPTTRFFRVLYGAFLDKEKGAPRFFPMARYAQWRVPWRRFCRSFEARPILTIHDSNHGPGIRCRLYGIRDTDLTNLAREVIAQRIIAAAKRGERSPYRLCKIAVAAIRGARKAG